MALPPLSTNDSFARLTSEHTAIKVSLNLLEGQLTLHHHALADLGTKVTAISNHIAAKGFEPLRFGDYIRLANDEHREELIVLDTKYTIGPEQFRISLASRGAVFRIVAGHGCPAQIGQQVVEGDTIRLEHAATGLYLHSHPHKSPRKGGNQVTGYWERDPNDNFYIRSDVAPGSPITYSSTVAFVHVATSCWLHISSHHLESSECVREVDGLASGALSVRACRWFPMKDGPASPASSAVPSAVSTPVPKTSPLHFISSLTAALLASYGESFPLPALAIVVEREDIFIQVLDANPHFSQPRDVYVQYKWADREIKWTDTKGSQHLASIRRALLDNSLDNAPLLTAVFHDLLRVYFHQYRYQPHAIVFLGCRASLLSQETASRAAPEKIPVLNLAAQYPVDGIVYLPPCFDRSRLLGTFWLLAGQKRVKITADEVTIDGEVAKRNNETDTLFSVTFGCDTRYYVWTGSGYLVFQYGGAFVRTKDHPSGMLGQHTQTNGTELAITASTISYNGKTQPRCFISPTCFYAKDKTSDGKIANWWYIWSGLKYIVVKQLEATAIDMLHRDESGTV